MENRKIGKKIKCLSNLIKRQFDASETIAQARRVTGTQGWVIGFLYENRGKEIFQRDVETHFEIRRPTASGILRLMEKNGLVERSPVPYDQRLKKLTLTEKAIKLQENVLKEICFIESKLCAGISEAELDVFIVVLDRMTCNLQS